MKRRDRIGIGLVLLVLATLLAPGAPRPALAAPPAQEVPLEAGVGERLALSYAAKFVCTEALQPGQLSYSLTAPLVYQKTDVLVHNPNFFGVELYKKAVISKLEVFDQVEQGQEPGKWKRVTLRADYSFRIDCDDIAKLLTGNAAATFIGTYGQGVTVEGFVVIAVGPQQIAGTTNFRYAQLDVTADYVRGSEFLKKDVHYQPWWWWWPFALPWRLGYAYQRLLPIAQIPADQPSDNIDCRGDLYKTLAEDVQRSSLSDANKNAAMQALEAGHNIDPTSVHDEAVVSSPALVTLIGRCDKVYIGTGLYMSVDYVLVSNRGPSTGYPWISGRWHDLTVVVPQNYDVDLDAYMREWQTRRWIAAGVAENTVRAAMVYYFPYWCGWGYWWWWWNAGGCTDISVGSAESLDVEQITPVRVFLPWPPSGQ
jgi:hypothetical protein